MAKNKKESQEKASSSFLDDDLPPLAEQVVGEIPEDEPDAEIQQEQFEDPDRLQIVEDKKSKRPQPPEELGNIRTPKVRKADIGNDLPKVKVIERDGFTARKLRSVEIGLSEKVLPPFTKGRTAVYKWIDRAPIDPLTGEAPDPKDPVLPGTYMFYDPFEMDPLKKSKLMTNFGRPISERAEDGSQRMRNTEKEIEFIAGFKRVVPESNYREYVFMELHPLNKSNRFRPSAEVSPLFERVDIRDNKGEMFRIAEAELAFDAEREVVELTDRDMIIGYAVNTGQIKTAGVLTGTIKTDLRLWARNHPREFFKMHNNAEVPVRLNIVDALSLGLITHEIDKKRFVDPEVSKEIFVYGVGEDPTEAFVKAMASPSNREIYNYIVDLLNYWQS